MWIVKLGGSLLGTEELTHWLDILARFSDGKIIIVPGGGIFADAVREAQRLTNLDDKSAHKMALMAMDQYGELLASLNPAIVTANSELEIAERGFQHRAIIWLPSKMVCADESIPTTWQVTSDSLAAWLATKLNAEHLVLVKSVKFKTTRHDDDEISNQISLERLIKEDVVDSHFGDFIAGKHFNSWVIGKADYTAFEQGIDADKLSATALAVRCGWH